MDGKHMNEYASENRPSQPRCVFCDMKVYLAPPRWWRRRLRSQPHDAGFSPCRESRVYFAPTQEAAMTSENAYRPWSPTRKRYIHARWWLADRVFSLAYRIQGSF